MGRAIDAMPCALAASTNFARAVSSSRLSIGIATAFGATVESTITSDSWRLYAVSCGMRRNYLMAAAALKG